MRYLVTGAAGFLGSHLVDALLAQGFDVAAFDHRLHGKCLDEAALARVARHEADIRDAAAIDAAAVGCDAIFHCAAMVGVAAYSEFPARTMETEIDGLRNVCRAALASGGIPIVYASSSAVYGHAGGARGLEEAGIVAPVSNYGIAKRFNELYLAAQFAEYGLASVALRIFNIYGPRQDQRLVIPRFIAKALAGEAVEIYGDGSQTRDFVYVGDVVRTALACAGVARGCEVVNVCSGAETGIRGLAETVIRLTGSKSQLFCREQPQVRAGFEVARCYGSRERLQAYVGAAPVTSLADGLADTIDAFRGQATASS